MSPFCSYFQHNFESTKLIIGFSLVEFFAYLNKAYKLECEVHSCILQRKIEYPPGIKMPISPGCAGISNIHSKMNESLERSVIINSFNNPEMSSIHQRSTYILYFSISLFLNYPAMKTILEMQMVVMETAIFK